MNVWFMFKEMRFELIPGSIRLRRSIDSLCYVLSEIVFLSLRNELEKTMSFSLDEDERVSLIHVLERTE